jgi:hypothetical protein
MRGVCPLQLSGQRQSLIPQSPASLVQDLPRCRRRHSFIFAEGSNSGGCRVVTPHSQSSPVETRLGGHTFFSDLVRFVLAPLILLFSGFFTANFIIGGSYSWSQTSRTLALTLTVLILSREFVYKEQLSRNEAPARAWSAVLYSCVLPYVIGVVVMVALWAL